MAEAEQHGRDGSTLRQVLLDDHNDDDDVLVSLEHAEHDADDGGKEEGEDLKGCGIHESEQHFDAVVDDGLPEEPVPSFQPPRFFFPRFPL